MPKLVKQGFQAYLARMNKTISKMGMKNSMKGKQNGKKQSRNRK